MELLWVFLTNSILLGIGLAADAFSVSVVNGINYPHIKYSKAVRIAGVFAFFQAFMPMSGWFLTNTILKYFKVLQRFLPWISQVFLLGLGINMILEKRKENMTDTGTVRLTGMEVFVQGIATSIDALLIGLTIAAYSLPKALICSLIIAGVTFILCFLGVHWGKKVGLKLAGKASVFGGGVLIFIAVEHFLRTFFS